MTLTETWINTSFYIAGFLLIGIIAVSAYLLFKTQKANDEKIKNHKKAMRDRIANEDNQINYTILDYSLFQEHKDSLIARIQDEDWFEKFISLLFVRPKKTAISQVFTQKNTRQNYELKDVLELSRLQPVLIIGDAGSGKTTSLHRIALDLCSEQEEIPLLLNLALYQAGDDLLEMMNTERKLDKNLISKVFSYGKGTLLIDQLNEIKEDQGKALDDLSKLMTKHKGNRYLIAVRTSGYLRIRNKTESFIAIEVEPLSLTKVSSFLEGYLGKENAHALLAKMDYRVRGLCTNPLMLSMVASVYEATKDIPGNRSELYEQFLYQLLHNWDQKIHHSLLAAYVDDVLAFISYRLNPMVTAHPITVIQALVSECVPEFNKKYVVSYSTQTVADTLQQIAVTRIDRLTYRFFFIHQSIQEFYAAKYIVSELESGQLNIAQLEDKLQSLDWIEPLFFVCGLLKNATDLIVKLMQLNRLFVAAQCVQNAQHVDPTVVDDLIVYTLTEFKYGDEAVGEQEVVAYDMIRALRIISDRKSNTISKRLIDDINFFLEKYSTIREYHTIIPSDELSDEEIMLLIESHENSALEADYLRTLGQRKARSAVDLVSELAKNDSYSYRDDAIWALGEIGLKSHTRQLIEMVNGKYPSQIVVAACNALIRASQRQQNNEESEEVLDVELTTTNLVDYISTLSNPSREAAAWALSQIAGSSVWDVYVEHMSTGSNYYQRAMFVYLTGLLGIKQAIDKLIKMYPLEKEAHVREDIIYSLGELMLLENYDLELQKVELKRASEKRNSIPSKDTQKVIEVLVSATHDEDAVVRMQAVYALAKSNAPHLNENIEHLYHDEARFVRQATVDVINTSLKEDKTSEAAISLEQFTMQKPSNLFNEVRDMSTILVEFLIEVGRWAKNELSERWKLRRKQGEIDLLKQEEVRTDGAYYISSLINERSMLETQEIIQLISRKRDAILRAQSAKLADREEFDAQKITKSAFEYRTRENNETIKEMLGEIQQDLEKLGIRIIREKNI